MLKSRLAVFSAFSLTATLLLSSCGSQVGTDIPNIDASSENMFRNSKSVPNYIAQALTVKSAFVSGMTSQEVSEKKVFSTVIYDFYGNPFYYLTLLSKVGDDGDDFWSALDKASKLRDDEIILSANGATNIRSLGAFQSDGSLAKKLIDLRNTIGKNIQLVSPGGAVIYVKNNSNFFNIDEGKIINSNFIEEEKKNYNNIVKSIANDQEYINTNLKLWEGMEKSTEGQNGRNMLQSALKNQNLNLKVYTSSLRNQDFSNSSITSQSVVNGEANDYMRCEGWFCQVKVRSAMTGYNGPLQGSVYDNPKTASVWSSQTSGDFGNQQSARNSPALVSDLTLKYSSDKWALRSANPLNSARIDWDQTGCGPTAFMRLVAMNETNDFDFRKAVRDSLGSDYARYTSAQYFARPVDADGVLGFYEPYITQRMGGGELNSGTLVTPWGLKNGAVSIFNEMGLSSKYSIEGDGFFNVGGDTALGNTIFNLSRGIDFNFNAFTWGINWVVRSSIGMQNRPVLYPYKIGSFNGYGSHYSVAVAYRSWDNWAYSDVYLYNSGIEGVGGPTGWINVTNRWDSIGGAYAILKK